MKSNRFEKSFDQFLERHEYDEAESALFDMVRIAFSAGWRAAGGDMPRTEKVVELLPLMNPSEKDRP